MTAPAATTSTCPRCWAPVISTANGKTLDAQPHRLGVTWPDGTPMNRRDFLFGYDPANPKGHRFHVCQRPAQAALWGNG